MRVPFLPEGRTTLITLDFCRLIDRSEFKAAYGQAMRKQDEYDEEDDDDYDDQPSPEQG